MNITETTGLPVYETRKPSQEELQREYDYLLAEELTKKLLDKGLISEDEAARISAKNRRTFSPFIAGLMP